MSKVLGKSFSLAPGHTRIFFHVITLKKKIIQFPQDHVDFTSCILLYAKYILNITLLQTCIIYCVIHITKLSSLHILHKNLLSFIKYLVLFSKVLLSTFRSLWELLSGFVSTNTTQILQARKQMECDNNKHLKKKQFNNHNKQDKNN